MHGWLFFCIIRIFILTKIPFFIIFIFLASRDSVLLYFLCRSIICNGNRSQVITSPPPSDLFALCLDVSCDRRKGGFFFQPLLQIMQTATTVKFVSKDYWQNCIKYDRYALNLKQNSSKTKSTPEVACVGQCSNSDCRLFSVGVKNRLCRSWNK